MDTECNHMTLIDPEYLDRESHSKSTLAIQVADDRINPIEVEIRSNPGGGNVSFQSRQLR